MAGKRSKGNEGSEPEAAGTGARQGTASPAYWIVLTGTVAALAVMRQGVHLLRSGTLVFAGALLAAAVARLILPERRAGLLSSRRRAVDVVIFTALGVGLLVAGLVVPTPG